MRVFLQEAHESVDDDGATCIDLHLSATFEHVTAAFHPDEWPVEPSFMFFQWEIFENTRL